jgi:AcrR family transcriptional regulator
MSTNERKRRPAGARKRPDRRATRTRDRLGDALVALIQEKPFDEITVQQVLDRAKVGRSTFYVHYRDKNDLFMSDVEEFLDHFSNLLLQRAEKSDRVAPVAEFFTHVASARQLYDAFVRSGRIHDFFDLARGHFARSIDKRLKQHPKASALAPDLRSAMAYAAAGSMLSLLQWWLDRGMKQTPEAMDKTFHRIVWSGVPPRA